MKRILKNSLLFLLVLLWILACKSTPYSDLKNGDLLFVTAKSSGLSGAINNVTQKNETESFDHIGLLRKEGAKWFVLHSEPKKGSWKQELPDFIKNQTADGQTIVVYRLRPPYRPAVNDAIKKAETLLGKPYNDLYILNEQSYYCSDFIERAFRGDAIFKLEPMTFKDPKTGKVNDFWREFYSAQGVEVPEGKLGCNPNGMASNPKIFRVKNL